MDKNKEELLYEQLEKQYELNKKQTESLCNVMNSIKSIFKYMIIGFTVILTTIIISYFWSPQDYTYNVNGNQNATAETMSNNTIDTIGGEEE